MDYNFKNSKGLAEIVEGFLKDYFDMHENVEPLSGLYNVVIAEVERALFRETLKRVQKNQKKAAHILGINRNTLHYKLKALNIDKEDLFI